MFQWRKQWQHSLKKGQRQTVCGLSPRREKPVQVDVLKEGWMPLTEVIIIIIIIFINCSWVVTRCQWLFDTYTKYDIGLLLSLRREGYMRSMQWQLGVLETIWAFDIRQTQGNQVKPVSRWPVAGPSEYWLLASSPAAEVKTSIHTVRQLHNTQYNKYTVQQESSKTNTPYNKYIVRPVHRAT